jgi:hypothetical protein
MMDLFIRNQTNLTFEKEVDEAGESDKDASLEYP